MTQNQINGKHWNNTTIRRGKSSGENPYSLIPKKLIDDPSLSPSGKWVIMYLISFRSHSPVTTEDVVFLSQRSFDYSQVHGLVKIGIERGYLFLDDLPDLIVKEMESAGYRFEDSENE